MNEKFNTPWYPKSDTAVKFIDIALRNNFIFANLSPNERTLLIAAMSLEVVSAGTIIIQQGSTGDFFYVIQEGHVQYYVDKVHVGSTGEGGSFGELALLYNCPRAATCLATIPCRLWKVDQKTFRYMLANNSNAQSKDIHHVLRKMEFLKKLEDRDLSRIADALTSVTFQPNDRILTKGDAGEFFYIIREGSVRVHDIGFGDSQYMDQVLKPGQYFGERALLTGEPRAACVTAISKCVCLCLSRDTFEKVLGPLQGLIDAGMKKQSLLGVPIFSDSMFQPHEIVRLTELITEVVYEKGTILAEQGKPYNANLYIIRSGEVAVANDNGVINNLQAACYFGDKYLKEEEGFISKQTITVQAKTTCGVLSRRDILSVILDMDRLGNPMEPKQKYFDNSIRFRHLRQVRILGVGTFGKVWLVQHNRTCRPYALKCLSKREIMGHHQVDGVIREKNIMASLDHPFVVNLINTYQDEKNLYMLIELVQGGELFSVIHNEHKDGIKNGRARFYAACILESLTHLHHRCICYRDLKPENILIDNQGYCVLVDLGFAKIVVDKTFTLCGTPEYLAPEIILSKGHDKGVDYWAFGVLIYEMLVGRSPFFLRDTDQVSLFKRIVQVKYSFPSDLKILDTAVDIIQKLIVRKLIHRLGCLSRGDCDVRDHQWFEKIDVKLLLAKKIPPPWTPKLDNVLDDQHFDSYRHLEVEEANNLSMLTQEEQTLFQLF